MPNDLGNSLVHLRGESREQASPKFPRIKPSAGRLPAETRGGV